MSEAEEIFLFQAKAMKLPDMLREYRFHPTRKWRFDFAMIPEKLAIEIEGGTWAGGRHVRGKGFENDCYKYNAAAILGWRVLRFTTDMVKKGEAVQVVMNCLSGAEA